MGKTPSNKTAISDQGYLRGDSMTNTCGQCQHFDVSTGQNGGKLRNEHAPGRCECPVTLPPMPIAIVLRWDFGNRSTYRHRSADKCVCFIATEVTAKKAQQLLIK